MTAADKFSMLDSGRIDATFDPMRLAPLYRSRVAGTGQDSVPAASREPPSLDLLAEMIKEEIRQASGLRQALDRVGAEAGHLSTQFAALSIGDGLNECENEVASCAKPVSPTQASGKRQKRVQFVVPDDVRFRWLGIFQQPADSDGSSSSDSEVPASSLQVSSRSPVDHSSSDSSATATGPSAIETDAGTAGALENAFSSVPPSALANTPLNDSRLNRKPVEARTDSLVRRRTNNTVDRSKNRLDAAPVEFRKAGTRSTEPVFGRRGSLDDGQAERDYVLLSITSNSSVEAVYGGSRPDTRESSVPNSVKNESQAKGRRAQTSGGMESGGFGKKTAQSRLGRLLQAGEPNRNWEAAEGRIDVHDNGQIGKCATISGRSSGRIAAQMMLQASHEYAGNTEHNARKAEAPSVQRPSGNKSAAINPLANSHSAFAQPSLVTSKITVPKRCSVSPTFSVPQNGPLPDKAGLVPVHTNHHPVSRAESAQSTTATNGTPPSSARRRNSLDGSSISSHGAQKASSNASVGSGDQQHAPAVPPSPRRNQPSGLFRRVTTSAALRKSNQHSSHEPQMGDGSAAGGGIIGGTREFFKHRLRPRTHSNDEQEVATVLPYAPSPTNEAMIRMDVLASSGADPAERPRRRSDVEVKSRDSSMARASPMLPSQPTMPERLQRHAAGGGRSTSKQDKSTTGAAGTRHKQQTGLPPLPPPPAAPSSSSSGGQSNEVKHGQRKSLDEHAMHSKARTRTSSGEDAHFQPTIRMTTGQFEVLKPRPASGGGDSERFGTRSKPRRNTGESASSAPLPQPPPTFSRYVGRSSERPTSAHEDSDAVLEPPPVPQMPSPPLLPTVSAGISPQDAAKSLAVQADRRQHPAGDVDSIDYHLRRLRPDRKGRRSSFMTTISHMLGRKE
ncbi:hypothetical protein GGI04_001391 [Coemansia thaxteri]|nr:hypothetical protein GGI04_001391 [Coemansia thaxteri]